MGTRVNDEDSWLCSSWEGAEAAALAAGARATLAERLRWLETTSRAARALLGVEATAAPSDGTPGPPSPSTDARGRSET